MSYAAPGRQVSRYALRGGHTAFLFVFASGRKLPAAHDMQAQKSILQERFGRDRWECPEILAASGPSSELYFDAVSQIRMERWSDRRVALVGDACFCPSLLAGQGSALAMTGAYILAGELARAGGDYRIAFATYEKMFHPLIARKQRAAKRFDHPSSRTKAGGRRCRARANTVQIRYGATTCSICLRMIPTIYCFIFA